nr:hypothetical protein [uncultured Carboxylicivirga sp.]
MKKHFIITTDKKTALAIEDQFKFGSLHEHRSLELGKIEHEAGFSQVKIQATTDAGIKPEDIFFLGLFTGMKVERKLTHNDC